MLKRIIKTCKDCNKPYSISGKELKWLEDRNLHPFERCRECRRKRKESHGRKR